MDWLDKVVHFHCLFLSFSKWESSRIFREFKRVKTRGPSIVILVCAWHGSFSLMIDKVDEGGYISRYKFKGRNGTISHIMVEYQKVRVYNRKGISITAKGQPRSTSRGSHSPTTKSFPTTKYPPPPNTPPLPI